MKKLLYSVIALLCFQLATGQNNLQKQPSQQVPIVRGFMVSKPEYVDYQTLVDVKKWGANVIRLQIFPVRYAYNRQQHFWDLFPEYLQLIQQKVDEAKALGLKVVIDLHEPPFLKDGKLTPAPYWGTDEFWNDKDLKPAFIKMWEMIARKFCSPYYQNTIWAYDLYNEPQQNASIPHKWRAMFPDIVKAIRAIDKNKWLVYEPGPWGEPAGYIGMDPIKDDKIIYSAHMYEPQKEFTHQGVYFDDSVTTFSQAFKLIHNQYPGMIGGKYWNKDSLRKVLQPVRDFQLKHNVPVYIGEFSVVRWTPVASAVQWLKDVIDIYDEYGWSWSYHAFREWHGWSLEHREGTTEFWYKGDPDAPLDSTETKRARVFKDAFKINETINTKHP